jgi:hypothetical protein
MDLANALPTTSVLDTTQLCDFNLLWAYWTGHRWRELNSVTITSLLLISVISVAAEYFHTINVLTCGLLLKTAYD